MKGIIILLFTVCAAVVHAQTTILVEECPKEQEIDWTIEKLMRHEYCNKFYKCTLGKPVEYICPADLWFNLETQQCDWRHNVDCTDRYVPDLTTTLEPTTSEPTTPEPTTPEPTTPEPTTPEPTTPEPTTPEPTTPEPTTPEPTTPEPTTPETTTPEPPTPEPTTSEPTTPEPTTPEPTTPEPTTPEPTTPEPTTPEPTTPEPTTPEPTTTSTTTTTTPAPTTTTSTTTTTTPPPITTKIPETFLPNGCPTNPQIHWLLPHETDCNAFYYCVWGQLVQRQCPATLHFNRVIQVCDWPWDAGCPASLNKHLGSRQQMR